MSSDDLLNWYTSQNTSVEWKASDFDSIKNSLKDIQRKKGSSKRDKQVLSAIDGKFTDFFRKNSDLNDWVNRDNNQYVDRMKSLIDNATSTISLKQRFTSNKDESYEKHNEVISLYEDKLGSFDKEVEDRKKDVMGDIRSRTNEIRTANVDELIDLLSEFGTLADEVNLSNSEKRSLYGKDIDRRRGELLGG